MTSFSSINNVNLVKCLLCAKQVVSNAPLTNTYWESITCQLCWDAEGGACKGLALGFQGLTYVPNKPHGIMHFVSPGSLQGREDNPVPTSGFSQSLWNWKKAQILTLHCILAHVLPAAMSISWRKLELLTFYTAQSRHCCCWHQPSQAASAECCENFGTENVLSEASETHGLDEFLK